MVHECPLLPLPSPSVLQPSFPQPVLPHASAPLSPYIAQMFYEERKDTANTWMVHFVIVKNDREFKEVS